MPVPTSEPNRSSRYWLTAALDALDREGEEIAAAYVSMALARVSVRTPAVKKAAQ